MAFLNTVIHLLAERSFLPPPVVVLRFRLILFYEQAVSGM